MRAHPKLVKIANHRPQSGEAGRETEDATELWSTQTDEQAPMRLAGGSQQICLAVGDRYRCASSSGSRVTGPRAKSPVIRARRNDQSSS